MAGGLAKMTIVNGVIQRAGDAATPAASSSGGSSGGVGSSLTEPVFVCGYALPRYALLGAVFLASLLGGVRGGMLALFGLGLGYLASSTSSSGSAAATPSFSSSLAAPRRGGGLSNVRGVGDLPKDAPKGG